MKPNSTNLLPSDRLAATPPSVTLSLVTTALGAAFQSIQNDGLSVDQSQSDQPVQAHQNLTHLHVPTNLSYFEAFTSYYSEVHGWISLTVCIFGIIANIVNIIVLTSVLIITKYGEVSQDQTGVLYGFTPVLLMLAKPIFCSFADKWVVHEWVLLGSIIGLATSYGSLAILPLVPDKQLVWWLSCVFMCIGHMSQGVVTSITDSLVLKVVEYEGHSNFGEIRMWGSIGWGVIGMFAGWLNNLDTFLPRYVPGLLLFIFAQLVDCVLVLMNFKKIRMDHLKSDHYRSGIQTISQCVHQTGDRYTENSTEERRPADLKGKQKNKPICKLVFLTFYRHPSLVKYVLICVVIGMMTGLNWNYYPMYLERVLTDGDSSLIGYLSLVECFGSEIPFFYFASGIVERIGVKGSMNLALLAFGIRYLLYSFFTSSIAYYILFVDLLHGITFGLFYSSMNILSSTYSKKMAKIERDHRMKCTDNEVNRKTDDELTMDDSAFATMQGLLSASYEGVGCGVGNLLSGVIIQHFGWLTASLSNSHHHSNVHHHSSSAVLNSYYGSTNNAFPSNELTNSRLMNNFISDNYSVNSLVSKSSSVYSSNSAATSHLNHFKQNASQKAGLMPKLGGHQKNDAYAAGIIIRPNRPPAT